MKKEKFKTEFMICCTFCEKWEATKIYVLIFSKRKNGIYQKLIKIINYRGERRNKVQEMG